MDESRILNLICAIPALVAGLTVHEFAHAWMADRLGDPTPRREGRLTLDPIVHIDPFGALFFIISSLAGFGLGWAKPVMTDPRNLKHPHRDGLLIAIAGPISNILQAPIWLLFVVLYGFLVSKFGGDLGSATGAVELIYIALTQGVIVNLVLAVFNMVPIPPLDGHWVLGALAGEPVRQFYNSIRPYSFLILILLLNVPNPSLFDYILMPVIQFAASVIYQASVLGMRLAM